MNLPQIIFGNKDFVVVYKPHGLNSDQDKLGNPSVENWLQNFYNKKIYLVHRLDRPVSGLLIATWKKSVLQYLQKNWQNYQKKYLALVEGNIYPEQSLLTHYHFKDLKNFKACISNIPKDGYQICKLKYKKVKQNQKFSLLEIELITGKYHQIRAQFAYLGHPILGDYWYGSNISLNPTLPTIALTAYQLNFFYPNPISTFQFKFLPKEDFWKL